MVWSGAWREAALWRGIKEVRPNPARPTTYTGPDGEDTGTDGYARSLKAVFRGRRMAQRGKGTEKSSIKIMNFL